MRSVATARARRSLGVLACLLGAALALAGPPAAPAAVELRLTHPADLSHPVHLAAERMVKRIADRTGGQVKITIFPNNALGAPPEAAQQVRLGVIDLMLLNPANMENVAPRLGVINIPYQFDDYAHAHRTLDRTASEWLQAEFKKAGYQQIAYFEWGFRALTNSVRPVNAPEDVKGLKVRVPPELAIKAAFEALGAVTATIAFPEVYMALATKTVDGQDNPLGTVWAAKFFQVQKHVATTKHIYATIVFGASPKAWDRLTPEQRAIVTEEGRRAGEEARREVREKEEAYLADMQKAGLQVTRPDVATFRALMAPAYAQLKKVLGEDTWAAWSKLVDAARK
ncbi:MAG: TRAP transporter substrate-binding protein [Candidatus Methylomirabilales bacterium]